VDRRHIRPWASGQQRERFAALRHRTPEARCREWFNFGDRHPTARHRGGERAALTAKNLEALGPERLAGLLEISEGNGVAKGRPSLALAGAQSPAELTKEMRK
jgi:hypothetical protein